MRETFNSITSNVERRAALSSDPDDTGIDFIDVETEIGGGWRLLVHFIPADAAVDKVTIPPGITRDRIAITQTRSGGQAGLRVESVVYPPDGGEVLGVNVVADDDEDPASALVHLTATYELTLLDVAHIDPMFASAQFTLTPGVSHGIDPSAPDNAPGDLPDGVEINYLAKDYNSFRTLMLDHLTLSDPEWRERNPSDVGVMVVETLAYAADYLSYYQDAVATESYLGTARQRTSVRRHARLLDYRLHEGCNARTWVQLQVDDEYVVVERGTQLLTRGEGGVVIAPGSSEHERALARAAVFETMHTATLFMAHNDMALYGWGSARSALQAGSTSAILRGHLADLRAGDVLVFEEVIGPEPILQADPAQRHAVRLAAPPKLSADTLSGESITQIEWMDSDALPFDFPIASPAPGVAWTRVRGNIVLADHGRTIAGQELPRIPPEAPYRPVLSLPDLTFQAPYNHAVAVKQGASAALSTDSRKSVPAITLLERRERNGGERNIWRARPDLLGSAAFAREFVVEIANDRRATLRFGDGHAGLRPRPGCHMSATYRVGSGRVGNIGPDALSHIVTEDGRIIGVRNLLGAVGGRDPEAIEHARLRIPHAFRTEERCVTAEDYAAIASRYHGVRRAVARLRWTGSWQTAFVYIQRHGRDEDDPGFRDAVRRFMEPYRLPGYEITIHPPYHVSLEIALRVYVAPGHSRGAVRRRLAALFGDTELPDGENGFFHPDNFSFGEPLYLSRIISLAMTVQGVLRVEAERFGRWGAPPAGELAAGVIQVRPLEIIRVANDPDAPANGTITFSLEGGL